MRRGLESEVDSQKLLPEDLRQKWVVVDRLGGHHLFLGGMLFGGGVAITGAGYIVGRDWMQLGLPVGLALMYLLKTLRAPSERRLLSELRGRI